MRLAASLLACALLIAGAADASAAKKDKDKDKEKDKDTGSKPALVGSYGDWKVYHSGAGKGRICYLLAEPKAREPDDSKRDKAYAFISERPAEHVRNEISFVMGYDVGAGSEPKEKKKDKKSKKDDDEGAPVAPTAVVGEAEFDLIAKGADLFVKNPAEEGKVIDEMRKGVTLVIKAPAKRGHTADSYSLSGFSQAIDRAIKDCTES
jgi:hypothetical protein